MKLLAALAFAMAPAIAAAQVDPKTLQAPPASRWFNLDRSSTGYVAGGNLGGMLWAFHVRGYEMKRLQPTTFSIDGAILQVRAVPRESVKDAQGGLLAAHKRAEQAYQAKGMAGVTFVEHDFCRGSSVAHEQWVARAPSGVAQAFVTFEVGDYILMVMSPYENEQRRAVAARSLGEVCSTLQLNKLS